MGSIAPEAVLALIFLTIPALAVVRMIRDRRPGDGSSGGSDGSWSDGDGGGDSGDGGGGE